MRARVDVHIEADVLARQMIGQRAALRGLGWRLRGDRLLRLGCCDVGVQVFERQRQLVRVYPFRAATVLSALELLDDRFQPLDLALAFADD